VTQDLYPERQVGVEVSDEDNTRRTEPIGDDAGGVGAPSVETLVPNPIGSSVVEQPRPPAADQAATTAPSGRGVEEKMHCARW
jgi:hypothetical protein